MFYLQDALNVKSQRIVETQGKNALIHQLAIYILASWLSFLLFFYALSLRTPLERQSQETRQEHNKTLGHSWFDHP